MEAQNQTPQDTPNPNPNETNTQTPPPPPSLVTSPSHEFSFTISFNQSNTLKCNQSNNQDISELDFSPADDIFLHGHLLPLHLLSHPAVPPRVSSDIFIENFTLPLDHSDRNFNYNASSDYESMSVEDDNLYHDFNFNATTNNKEPMRNKNSLSSILFSFAKMKKHVHENSNGERKEDDDKRSKRRKGFDMKRLMKKYLSLMDTIFTFKGSSEKAKRDIRRRPYSFSGHSNRREWEGHRQRKGQYSAPASMRTSPTNSGLLSASMMTISSSDESTMEELQNAIQAAIAHCKNSSSVSEKYK